MVGLLGWRSGQRPRPVRHVCADWLKAQPEQFIAGIAHAALDPFRGCANAIRDRLPDAVAELDTFDVVKVRHEALCVRMEVRDLHLLVVAAAMLTLRAA